MRERDTNLLFKELPDLKIYAKDKRCIALNAASGWQHKILTEYMFPRAKEILKEAQARNPRVLFFAMEAGTRYAHLKAILDANKLQKIERMWHPLKGVINFQSMYNLASDASDEHKVLMKKWRIHN
jgi:hypothetical protein